MENRKDIGKAINDKLNSLDKTPREQVWIGINEELQKKKKRRFAFFFLWTKAIGLLLVGAIAAFYVYRQNDGFGFGTPKDPNNSIIVNESNDNINGSDKNKMRDNTGVESPVGNDNKSSINSGIAADDENSAEGNNSINKTNSLDRKKINRSGNLNNNRNKPSVNSDGKNNSGNFSSKSGKAKSKLFSKAGSAKLTKKKSGKKSKKAKDNLALLEANLSKKDSAVADLTSLQDKKTDGLIPEVKPKKKDSIPAKKEKDLTKNINMYKKEAKDSVPVLSYKKFDFDVYVSPTFYGYFGKDSTLDNRLDSLPKKSEVKFSYGVGLTYDMSDKLSFRIGYSKVNISYVTQNAPIDVPNYNGIGYHPNISNASIYAMSSGAERMDITQKISYTEIPFEFKYKFSDKKISLKSSAGFSYLIMNGNTVSVKTLNGYSREIGKTKKLTTSSISFNLGVEANYPLFKNMKIFIEPTFNYQVKGFSDSAFKPYYFGIHTGLRYSFNN
jgi:hypothetical protein